MGPISIRPTDLDEMKLEKQLNHRISSSKRLEPKRFPASSLASEINSEYSMESKFRSDWTVKRAVNCKVFW